MRALLCLLLLAQADSFDSTFRAGLAALQQNDLARAREQLESASQMEPRRAHVWLALARVYWKQHETGLAGSAAEKAEQLAAGDPVVLHGLGVFYSESGHYEKAADCEAAYAAQTPRDASAYSRALQLYLQAGKPKAAIDLAQKALIREDRADLRNLLGKAYEADGRHAEAVREMREAVRLNPYEESYIFDLARNLLEHNQLQDATQLLEGSRKIFARSPQLELTLGVAYYGMRRFSDAVDAFLRVTRIDPAVEQPYVFLGRMIEQTEDKLRDVTAAFAALARANPDSYLANFLYGKALSFSGQPQQAEVLLRKSVAEHGKFWESRLELGVVLARKRDWAGAAQELAHAAELNPKNPAVHYQLARAYDRLGKTEEAKVEHALHEKLTREENASIRRQGGGIEKMDKLELPPR
jgi:tetratricopeptide (TPR) repeat protein